MSRVQIDPDSPYGVSLASRIASASSSNGTTQATGPNTSSRHAGSSVTAAGSPASTVGAYQNPGPAPTALTPGTPPARPAARKLRDPLPLCGRDQRPHLGLLVGRVADHHALTAGSNSAMNRS